MSLTSAGYVPSTVDEILSDFEATQRAEIDPAIDVDPDQPLGQINGIVAAKIASVEELLVLAFNATDPNRAEGSILDGTAKLTGTTRLLAKKTLVPCMVNVNIGTYAIGALTANVAGQPTNLFRNTTALTAAAPGAYALTFEAVEAGPIQVPAGTLTVKTVSVAGWNSITNAVDGVPGRLVELDSALRIRREEDIAASGDCTIDAIRTDVLSLLQSQLPTGVAECIVYENDTMFTDGNGVPAKSFETVIFDGAAPVVANATVAKTIFDTKPTGVQAFGATVVSVKDAAGNSHNVGFSRATQLTLYLSYDLTVNADWDPINGPGLVKAAALAVATEKLKVAKGVNALAFKNVPLSVPGVDDVPTMRLGFAPAPAGVVNLAVGARQRALLLSANIAVNIV